MIEETRYLIIGNSAGGIGAAEAIRGVDKTGPVTIVSDEPYPAYSRPLISEYLVSRCPVEKMLFRPLDFYEKSHIRTLLAEKAARVSFDDHRVEMESGRVLAWEKLLLATGGLPIVPGINGIGLKGVFTFNRLDDARAIDRFLIGLPKRQVKAVVIGGGLIGVSVTEALVKRGVEVTVVEMKERILNTILDEAGSALEEAALRQAGVEVVTGHTVAEIGSYSGGAVTSVCLDDNRPLLCQLVVVAIGVRPRLELAADIKTNRGIVVDRRMATSCPDAYACGDVAEAYDFIYGENRLTPVWPNAYSGGRVAGGNMAGVTAEYRGGTAMNAMKYFGINTVSAGMVSPPGDGYEVLSQRRGGIYKKVVIKDSVIVGMVFTGDIERSGIIYNLMKDRLDVSGFEEALVADDFSLACLPEEIWRAWLNSSGPAGEYGR